GLPRARVEGGVLISHAVYVDRFGNVQLDASHEDLAAIGLKLGRPVLVSGNEARFVRTFADADLGQVIIYEDSAGMLAAAINHGSAAERLEIGIGDELRIGPEQLGASEAPGFTCGARTPPISVPVLWPTAGRPTERW